MKYFGYMPNDFVNGESISVSFWTAGCPHRCPGCHNSEMWDYESGYNIPEDIAVKINEAISANGFLRDFSILGGEPLAICNLHIVNEIITAVRKKYGNSIKVYLWTGYTIEELQEKRDERINNILSKIDVLIDGKYIESERDITLPLRGSRNQRVLRKNIDF